MNNLVIMGNGRWARQIMLARQNLKLKKIFCITNKKNFFLKKKNNK